MAAPVPRVIAADLRVLNLVIVEITRRALLRMRCVDCHILVRREGPAVEQVTRLIAASWFTAPQLFGGIGNKCKQFGLI